MKAAMLRPVLEQAAGVPQRHLRKPGVFIAGKERLVLGPQRLVGVHAGAVVAKDRLGHEGDGLAVLLGHALDDEFVLHHVVGGLQQRVEAQVDFALAGGGDFVVVALDVHAAGHHLHDHLRAQILEVIDAAGRGSSLP